MDEPTNYGLVVLWWVALIVPAVAIPRVRGGPEGAGMATAPVAVAVRPVWPR